MEPQIKPKRRVRSAEERRKDLVQQLQLVDAREEARMRAMMQAVVEKLESVKIKANVAMKGKMHDACEQAITIIKPHTFFPGP
jgi:hypothetical protein